MRRTSQWGMPRCGKEQAPHEQEPGPHGGAHFPFVVPIDANFILTEPSLPKTTYKRDPMRSRDGVGKEHEIHNTDPRTMRKGGVTLREPHLVAHSIPSTSSLSAP
jgi:hypothetical protein